MESKKSRKLLITIGGVICILIIVSLVATFGSARREITEENVIEAIHNEFSLILGGDTETLNPIINTLHNGFEVEVISIAKIDAKSYRIKCLFSNYDVFKAFESFTDTNTEISLNDFVHTMTNRLMEQPKITNETELTLVISDDRTCQVAFTEKDLNYAMGGFLAFYYQMYGGEF